MNKNANIIRPESDDKLVMSVTLYTSDGTLFYDSELTKSVAQEEAIDLFNKGLMLVAVDDGFKRPTGITIGEEGEYTIAFGEGGSDNGGSDNGNILCYAASFHDSYYLFEDSEYERPISTGKDPLWYTRLVLVGNYGDTFKLPGTIFFPKPNQVGSYPYIRYDESICYLNFTSD